MKGVGLMEYMALSSYEDWYKKDVSPNLTIQQKKKLVKKISDISLEKPIYEAGLQFEKSEFPELAQYSHTAQFSGMQLYAIMAVIMQELGYDILLASQVALQRRE